MFLTSRRRQTLTIFQQPTPIILKSRLFWGGGEVGVGPLCVFPFSCNLCNFFKYAFHVCFSPLWTKALRSLCALKSVFVPLQSTPGASLVSTNIFTAASYCYCQSMNDFDGEYTNFTFSLSVSVLFTVTALLVQPRMFVCTSLSVFAVACLRLPLSQIDFFFQLCIFTVQPRQCLQH